MALIPGFNPKVIYWDVIIENVNLSQHFRSAIESIKCSYSITEPTMCEIRFNAGKVIEDVLKEGAKARVNMGYDRLNKATMIDGRILFNPDGSGDGSIQYSTFIVDDVSSMANKQKNMVFKGGTKQSIMTQIISQNGFIPDVKISDSKPIKAESIPKQFGETDLQFMYRYAKKWHCVVWIDTQKKTIHVVDSDKSHVQGDSEKIPNSQDMEPCYKLGYMSAFGSNNIAKLSWKREKLQSGGTPSVEGDSRTGPSSDVTAYEVEYEGQIWQMNKEVISDPKLAYELIQASYSASLTRQKEVLRKYYHPLTFGDPMHKNEYSSPGNSGGFGNLTINVTLNIGDPFLRVPRTCILSCGDGTPSGIVLPQYLFRDNPTMQKYFVNKIDTELSAGMIGTTIEATMSKRSA